MVLIPLDLRVTHLEAALAALQGGPVLYAEDPVGVLDGVNNVFTLSRVPSLLCLFLNGLLQQAGVDFSIAGRTITMTDPPESWEWLRAVYTATGATLAEQGWFDC